MKPIAAIFVCCQVAAVAQEANSGFEFHGTLSEIAAYTHQLSSEPRNGGPVTGGFRAVLYPTWKLGRHWSVSGALQVHSRPYFDEEFATQGFGMKVDILRAALTYSRVLENRSLTVRAGQLSSAFGSFLLRYDDAVNPLIDIPLAYGYYERGVTNLGLVGAQVDATAGKLDVRAQFVNSSPVNRRSIFDRDQYGNWTGGVGYTIAQGFRVGVSAYRGPYLDRQPGSYSPGDAWPRDLPGTAVGLDVQWARGPWSAYGEAQWFRFEQRMISATTEQTGYGELRRVLRPRWYVASRFSYFRNSEDPPFRVFETAVGFRPNRHQILKIGYEIQQGPAIRGTLGNTFALQLVTVLPPISRGTRD